MVANVQFATGSRTFAPKENNLGANLLLQLFAIFIIKTFSAPMLLMRTVDRFEVVNIDTAHPNS